MDQIIFRNSLCQWVLYYMMALDLHQLPNDFPLMGRNAMEFRVAMRFLFCIFCTSMNFATDLAISLPVASPIVRSVQGSQEKHFWLTT